MGMSSDPLSSSSLSRSLGPPGFFAVIWGAAQTAGGSCCYPRDGGKDRGNNSSDGNFACVARVLFPPDAKFPRSGRRRLAHLAVIRGRERRGGLARQARARTRGERRDWARSPHSPHRTNRARRGSAGRAGGWLAAAVLVLGPPEEDDADDEERHPPADGRDPQVVVGDDRVAVGLV